MGVQGAIGDPRQPSLALRPLMHVLVPVGGRDEALAVIRLVWLFSLSFIPPSLYL